ncbi:tape measure protein [Ancylobacter polymorphus]|uniref:Tape measure protein n=1 Tax=Ancylobacter polymorphus TaxID=223390 RepID=A0A9E6ZZS6_9HYPH|nr:tape measure protein [Ancylobacter polymorphus]UOK71715.1 tape measure protein [Ancylobacter polymorphus]
MATDLEALVLTISADTRNIKRQLDKLDSDVGRTAKNVDNQFSRAKRSMDVFAASVSNAGRALVASLGIGFAAGDFLKTVQSVDSLGASLKAITGDSAAAAGEMSYVTEVSERLGLELISTGNAYASLLAATKGTALEGEETRRIFEGVAAAMASLGKSSSDTEGALLAVQQMISKGTVSAEELRGQLGERLPGAFGLAAKAMGVTEQELGKMLENGVVPATELLPRLIDELNKLYDTGRKSTLTSEINRLNNAVTELYKTLADAGALSAITTVLGGISTALNDIRQLFQLIGVQSKLIGSGRFSEAFAQDPKGIALLRLRSGMGTSLTDQQSSEFDKLFGFTSPATTRPPPALGKSKSEAEKLDAYQRMTRMIQERTQAIQYETAAQASLNPLVNDYGFTMEKARAEADLLNAAERAKIEITPEVRQKISELATAYAEATVEAERLREEQQFLVDQAADLNDLGRDVLGGFISDMQNGVSAAQALENALARVADRLLDMALNAIFSPPGSGPGGLVGSFISAISGQRAGGGPVRAGSAYTVGEQGPETFVPNVSGRILPNHLSAGKAPQMSVVINNNAGANVSTQRTPTGVQIDINRMVEEAMVNQFQSNGRGAQAAARTFGLRRQTA